MKKYLLLVCALTGVLLSSCKLDKPILPGDKGYVAAVPPGGDTTNTGGGTGSIDTSLLAGTWTVKTTTSIIYSDGVVAASEVSPINLYTDVQLDNGAKTALFDGSFVVTDTAKYTLAVSGGKTTIQLSEDPFSRSSNGPVQITKLTATSMTWLAFDPMVTSAQGHKIQSAWQVVYTK